MWWLNVFFLINGVWTPGAQLEGWSPREYASEQECLERKSFAENECRLHPLKHASVWTCTFGEPAKDPPASLRGAPC